MLIDECLLARPDRDLMKERYATSRGWLARAARVIPGAHHLSGRVLNDPTSDSGPLPAPTYREFGDEPLMLARALPDIPIIVNKDRYVAGRWAESKLGSEVLVLDDAYQHLAVARDLNILLIDATDPFGEFEMPPFGRLREPLYGIKRTQRSEKTHL